MRVSVGIRLAAEGRASGARSQMPWGRELRQPMDARSEHRSLEVRRESNHHARSEGAFLGLRHIRMSYIL